MPKVAKDLTPLAVKNLKHSNKNSNPERYSVGGVSGLVMQITPNNAKSWLLRTTIAGKRRFIGLGSYPEVSLKDARDQAALEKQKIREGLDPIEERKRARAKLAAKALQAITFREVMNEYLDTKLKGKSVKSQRQWRSTLKNYAEPILGPLIIDDIRTSHILQVIEPIWHSKTETASRLRGRLEAILAFATVKGYRQSRDNPARWRGHLKEVLPAAGAIAEKSHMPAIQIKDAEKWFGELKQKDGISIEALKFLTLTASRSGEVRGALWSEIDFKTGTWIIPAERMKMRREHRVPLSDDALQILNAMPRFQGSDYIFPAVKGGALSDMALSSVMRRMHKKQLELDGKGWVDKKSKRPAVPHGLRSTFRSWAGEKTDYPREILELCLAHDIAGSVERAYMRSDILEKRREIMSEWAKFLTSKKSD